ncbi:hypothetical protein HMPREF0045_00124 [Actinomyces graevenitzii C83]|uniref:Metallo-beta-lactamase domain-containing protein n=1 Tax=Actinomyces graevenitzii C83 TaxID=435830 RepID=G9PDP1_9ACTO|nr:MBL fold metallo-hydrolase [Actinomyces graevenitzii]EHM89459.1 hypothetical protein HMPREF0045_00124 [Actinomyces graevenitzii C83]
MKLTIVGCSGSMSGRKSSASSYLVQAWGPNTKLQLPGTEKMRLVVDDELAAINCAVAPEVTNAQPDAGNDQRLWSLVLDFGPGSMGQLLNYLDPADLDAICISHCHADHMVDLVGMHVYRRWRPEGALGPVLCIGPSTTCERLRGVDGAASCEDYHTEFSFVTAVPGRSTQIGPFTVTPFTALHPVEAYGYLVQGPSEDDPTKQVTLAFTGDTDLCEGMSQMVSGGVDLLLAEAAFVEGRDVLRGMHLTGYRAGQLASEANAGQLVLTHIQPWTCHDVPLAEARQSFTGPVYDAQPGRSWSL